MELKFNILQGFVALMGLVFTKEVALDVDFNGRHWFREICLVIVCYGLLYLAYLGAGSL